jgi:hypothetical protein
MGIRQFTISKAWLPDEFVLVLIKHRVELEQNRK